MKTSGEAGMTENLRTEWSGRHPAEDRLRTALWTQLQAHRAAVGNPVGHIPRFVGSEPAAARPQPTGIAWE